MSLFRSLSARFTFGRVALVAFLGLAIGVGAACNINPQPLPPGFDNNAGRGDDDPGKEVSQDAGAFDPNHPGSGSGVTGEGGEGGNPLACPPTCDGGELVNDATAPPPDGDASDASPSIDGGLDGADGATVSDATSDGAD